MKLIAIASLLSLAGLGILSQHEANSAPISAEQAAALAELSAQPAKLRLIENALADGEISVGEYQSIIR